MNYNEFNKLLSMMVVAGMDFYVLSDEDGRQVVLMSPDGEMEVDSCIIRRGSHGYAEGLLETHKLNSCNGYESAEYVFNGWTQMLNEI